MDTRQPEGPKPVTPDEMMCYLDGELSPEERARVDRALETSTELRREVAVFRNLKTDLQGLHFHSASYRTSVWDRVNQHVSRPIGWGLGKPSLTGLFVICCADRQSSGSSR